MSRTPPIALQAPVGGTTDRLGGPRVALDPGLLDSIAGTGAEVHLDERSLAEAGRDWWPLAIAWALRGAVPARPGAVVRPVSTRQVSAVLGLCTRAGVPVTPMAGRSGVCGGSVPVFGGISLDTTGLCPPLRVDEVSLLADVGAGWLGTDLEAELGRTGAGYTLGHWPQSMALSTVGGWLACRSAGQLSTRYGKIEDMVAGLEVVLADGRVVHTDGSGPHPATGPSLTQLFVGSEGTLGVITAARLRLHPAPSARGRRAFAFASFAGGLDACRRVLRRGATPAVLRLYDPVESARQLSVDDACALVVMDEADPAILGATLAVVDDECARDDPEPATRLADEVVDRWLAHRNDVSALGPLWESGVVVDTVEVSAPWGVLAHLADDVLGALRSLDGTVVGSVHQSHAYPDGACLYFTFAGLPEPDAGLPGVEAYYRDAWEAVMGATRRHGGAISHHHGIGLNRARFLGDALGEGASVLATLKAALDPAGILNPGKLGLPSPFGAVPWP